MAGRTAGAGCAGGLRPDRTVGRFAPTHKGQPAGSWGYRGK